MKKPLFALYLLSTASLLAAAQPGRVGDRPVRLAGQALPDFKAANVRVDGAVVEPVKLAPDPARLRVPEGYAVSVFAEGLGNPRMIAVAEDGAVYVTDRKRGLLLMLRDRDGDGRAEEVRPLLARPGLHGVAIDGRSLFLVTVKDVYSATLAPDGTLRMLERIIQDLPDAGQHPNRTIAVGPDKMLYISVGSTCNACAESNDENATILRASLDGKRRSIFASGLRNTIGFDWHPRTGQLWGLDHGIDWLGDSEQAEELNRIVKGRQYGWPYIYAMGGHNPQDDPPGGLSMADWDSMSERPALGTDAHAAPMQMAFYRGSAFPAAEQGNAFAAFRGSWNRAEPSGYEIRRIRFDAAGAPVAIEPFVTGFLARAEGGGWGQRGRLAGLAVAKDGALLFSDDENGILYRVAYNGRGAAGRPLPPAPAVAESALPATLALARPETASAGRLAVSSPAFGRNPAIPREHSAYYDNVSPTLGWGAPPRGTRSFALLVEDPDAKSVRPFVHWLAWNIPAGATALLEGVPTAPQLPHLGNARQGRNSRGSLGWFGPRPPVGDPPHHYRFQLFALDTELVLLPGADRETLLRAMAGHVLAKGELTGTYGQAAPPTK